MNNNDFDFSATVYLIDAFAVILDRDRNSRDRGDRDNYESRERDEASVVRLGEILSELFYYAAHIFSELLNKLEDSFLSIELL